MKDYYYFRQGNNYFLQTELLSPYHLMFGTKYSSMAVDYFCMESN